MDDLDSVIRRDPAAKSRWEVLLCYPSVQVMLFYRLGHKLWKYKFYLLGRCVTQLGRLLTGIEIHPGAHIGRRFFADHGMGVVIGETAILGNDVTLYHDVTLGGVSPSEDSDNQRELKRHPTLEDGVIVGSGAQILGNITLGKNVRVGANSVVLQDIPECATVVGIPAKIIKVCDDSAKTFSPYAVDFQAEEKNSKQETDLRAQLNQIRKDVDELKEVLARRSKID